MEATLNSVLDSLQQAKNSQTDESNNQEAQAPAQQPLSSSKGKRSEFVLPLSESPIFPS